VENETFWPLRKRVDDLLHVLVTVHRKIHQWPSPEFRTYKSTSRQFDWLEHPAIPSYKNRVPMQMEDVGILWARKMVRLVGDRPGDKTFDLTTAGFEFHDEHCKRDNH
jgi:hypothetical protein